MRPVSSTARERASGRGDGPEATADVLFARFRPPPPYEGGE